MNLSQYRILNNKELIEDSEFQKNSYQVPLSSLSNDNFRYFITLVFNHDQQTVTEIQFQNVITQFKTHLLNVITKLGENPHQFKSEILPMVVSGEYRKSDSKFHLHCLLKQIYQNPNTEKNDEFVYGLNSFLNKSTRNQKRKSLLSKWKHHQLKVKSGSGNISWLNDLEDIFSNHNSFTFNLDGNDGFYDGHLLEVVSSDVTILDSSSTEYQPVQDYITKTGNESDLISVSPYFKKKTRRNMEWIEKIKTGQSPVVPSIYKSNVIRFIPDDILMDDLKTRPKDFLKTLQL